MPKLDGADPTRIGHPMPTMLLLLAACSDTKLNPTGDDTAAVGDTPLCPAYSGLDHAGQTWSWAITTSMYDATTDAELTAIEGDVVTVVEASVGTGDTFSGTWDHAYTWRCDADGAWLVAEHIVTHQESTGDSPYTYDSELTVTYTPGWLNVPVDMDSGSTWNVAFTQSMSDAVYGESSSEWAGTYTVENEEEITTSAGTFTTLEVNGAGTMTGAEWTEHVYRDAAVGVVLDDTGADLVGWAD